MNAKLNLGDITDLRKYLF